MQGPANNRMLRRHRSILREVTGSLLCLSLGLGFHQQPFNLWPHLQILNPKPHLQPVHLHLRSGPQLRTSIQTKFIASEPQFEADSLRFLQLTQQARICAKHSFNVHHLHLAFLLYTHRRSVLRCMSQPLSPHRSSFQILCLS